MQFRLKKLCISRKLYKEWYDETKTYRITWANQVQGVPVPGHYHACVKVVVNGREIWDFVMRRKPFKTLQKAVEECERHAKKQLLPTLTSPKSRRRLRR